MSRLFLTLLAFMFAVEQGTAQEIDLAAWQNASTDAPYDVTFLLQNPSGKENFGWNRNSADAAAGYNKHNTEFASSVYNNTGIESWYWAPVKNAELIWQDVEGLLAGTYRITAYVVAQIYNNSSQKGQCGRGSYLFAGDTKVNITSNKWQELSVTTTIGKDETLRIGINSDDTNENDWVSIAGVRIECIAFAGLNTLSSMSLDENFDVSVARQFDLADVVLIRSLSKDDYTPLYLPFDMSAEQCNEYFSEILAVTDATTSENNTITLSTEKSDNIKAGCAYLVKGKENGRVRIQASPVTISVTTPTSVTLPGGLVLTGTFRKHEGMDSIYLHETDTRMAAGNNHSRIKGYSFYITSK